MRVGRCPWCGNDIRYLVNTSFNCNVSVSVANPLVIQREDFLDVNRESRGIWGQRRSCSITRLIVDTTFITTFPKTLGFKIQPVQVSKHPTLRTCAIFE